MSDVARRVWPEVKNLVIYIAILLVFLEFASMKQADSVRQLKSEINTAVRTECLANTAGPIFDKYNGLVAILENQQLTAKTLNSKPGGDPAKAAADAAYAAQFHDEHITPPPSNCDTPLLP